MKKRVVWITMMIALVSAFAFAGAGQEEAAPAEAEPEMIQLS